MVVAMAHTMRMFIDCRGKLDLRGSARALYSFLRGAGMQTLYACTGRAECGRSASSNPASSQRSRERSKGGFHGGRLVGSNSARRIRGPMN